MEERKERREETWMKLNGCRRKALKVERKEREKEVMERGKEEEREAGREKYKKKGRSRIGMKRENTE